MTEHLEGLIKTNVYISPSVVQTKVSYPPICTVTTDDSHNYRDQKHLEGTLSNTHSHPVTVKGSIREATDMKVPKVL